MIFSNGSLMTLKNNALRHFEFSFYFAIFDLIRTRALKKTKNKTSPIKIWLLKGFEISYTI